MTLLAIRCDASPALGHGHLIRCLAFAEAARDRGADVRFLLREDLAAVERVRRAGFAADLAPRTEPASDWLRKSLARLDADALLVDVRDDTPPSVLAEVRADGVLVGVLDDLSERRLAADVVFYPPIPQVARVPWGGAVGRVLAGWEWVVLRSAFAQEPAPATRDEPQIFVAGGASDPAGFTLTALDAIERAAPDLPTTVLVGADFQHEVALRSRLARRARPADVVRDPPDVAGLLREADIAVVSFGVTAYEAAACGLPAVHLCLTQDHADSSSAFADAGIALTATPAGRPDASSVAACLSTLLADPRRRRSMGERARALVDGCGSGRVVDEMLRIAKGGA